jgi:hypothetical protein
LARKTLQRPGDSQSHRSPLTPETTTNNQHEGNIIMVISSVQSHAPRAL